MSKFTIEEQLCIKRILIDEFNLTEKRIAQEWLDIADVTPNSNDPTHWDYILHNKKDNYYVNLRFFPKITIEPTHTTNYYYGAINYKKDMDPKVIVDYIHNIIDKEEE
jgi:hypothetical protein